MKKFAIGLFVIGLILFSHPSWAAVTVNIAEPFVSQAPYHKWDFIHNESCEETNVIMAYLWINNTKPTSKFVEAEIQKLTKWGLKKFKTYDTTAEQTAQMARENYGLSPKILKAPTLDQLKKELDQGHIIVMSFTGRLFHSPYYTKPGPLYHMLTLKGYDDKNFITNDVGTNTRGADFKFSFENIMTAAHDWTGSAKTLLKFSAVALIFEKN
ncbi:MAG: hypothetical protein A2117_02735 [Candidatus Wildermuthbacteria bacterium GWA2_46_15]|uniref:Peptidase C39-like domain-containing protein n=1 Tax=Candidatus Wildermuthbacteria bacterium GWA2_46_15 TaxID=1802443 RepID=A0A1G2QM66_9BACT|nr:MAG: hypothetical protein A2117_02735 [Candidatus Wildermuthbacteria bacterium GWA2_46_15]